MFTYKKTIFLQETDVTGVIYFTAILQYAMEALEMCLQDRMGGLSSVFSLGHFLPVVHAEADLSAPLRVADMIEVELRLGKIGTKSFTLETDIWRLPERTLVGKTKIVHAALPKGGGKASMLSEQIIDLLNKI
ncbi:MAG: acyl-CoA thioesterase [Chlamydiae bacterium]|nr:acyl-CoA thioesterase [Chlamydiota bacterium]